MIKFTQPSRRSVPEFFKLFSFVCFALLLTLLATPVLAQEEEGDGFSPKAMAKAWRAGDGASIDQMLDDLWKRDRVDALKRSRRLLGVEDPAIRPFGLRAIAMHADVVDVIAALGDLDRRAVGERRWLILSLAKHPKEDTLPTLREMLKNSDELVRASAATVMGSYKDPEILAPLLPLLREPPFAVSKASDSDQHALQMALYGAFEVAAGLTAASAQELKVAYESMAKAKPQKEKDEKGPKIPQVNIRGKSYFELDRFNLLFDLGPKAQVSAARVEMAAKLATQATTRVLAQSQTLLGPLAPGRARLIVADAQRFSSYAGNSFRPGVSKANEVIMRDMRPEEFLPVLAHEYVHVLHQASFPKQPRWVAEGLAESLSVSGKASVWKNGGGTISLTPKDKVFSRLLNWTGGASSGSQEADLYRLAHVAVDSLRFGSFGATNERLFLFMSALNESGNPAATLKASYGLTADELDDRLRQWLAGPADAKPRDSK